MAYDWKGCMWLLVVPCHRRSVPLFTDRRDVGVLAWPRVATLDQEVEVEFGGWQSNNTEGAWVFDDRSGTLNH